METAEFLSNSLLVSITFQCGELAGSQSLVRAMHSFRINFIHSFHIQADITFGLGSRMELKLTLALGLLGMRSLLIYDHPSYSYSYL